MAKPISCFVFVMIAWLGCKAFAAPHSAANCLGASMQTLHPSRAAPVDARGVFIDANELFWPDQSTTNDYRIYTSKDASLFVRNGQTVRGADHVLRLDVEPWKPNDTEKARFGYLGKKGVRLRVSPDDRPILPALLQGQLVLVRQDAAATVLEATNLQLAALLDANFDAKEIADLGVSLAIPPGAAPDSHSTKFQVWAPTARAVSVCLYQHANTKKAALLSMQFDPNTGVWRANSNADLSGQFYQYLLDVPVPAIGIVRNRVTDPYSVSLSANSQRSYIADLNQADLVPNEWPEFKRGRALKSSVDMSIYELHVRDFSINDPSQKPAHRGKYLAFTDLDAVGVKHLKALAEAGITDLHLLPVFDFATVPELGCVTPDIGAYAADSDRQQASIDRKNDCFNWGYDPLHFGATEGSYSTDANDGAKRIVEFRKMVASLHRMGLRVGMDLVYNHTSTSGQNEQSVLDRIVPGYYQRLNAQGEVERSTCCDNTATEHAMMEKLMIDTTVRWTRDFGVDSFRFDLMGHQPKAAMLRLQAAVNKAAGQFVPLVGEGWNFGEVANNARFEQAAQVQLAGSGIATFSDRARDGARGGGCCDGGVDVIIRQGFLTGQHYAPNLRAGKNYSVDDLNRSADWVRSGLAGSIRSFRFTDATGKSKTLAQLDYNGMPAGYVAEPTEVVNYVENHDNPTLFDIAVLKLATSTSTAERARVQVLGAALVALSQGIPYFHAGMEGMRSKSLDRNSYDSGDWFNRIDWTLTTNYFAQGLPPASDNASNFDLFRPLLADVTLVPKAAELRWSKQMFLDLLRIRKSTTLLRLPSSSAINKRMALLNTGSAQVPGVVGAVVDGVGLAGANFTRLLYWVNVGVKSQAVTVPGEAKQNYQLHPIMQGNAATDQRWADAKFDASAGRFVIPPRTVVVYVVATLEP